MKAWDSKDKHYWDQMLIQKLASNVDEHARNKHDLLPPDDRLSAFVPFKLATVV